MTENEKSLFFLISFFTAVLWDVELYTQDKHFENPDRVHYFSK